jgi:uncharacterized protein YbbC (DUF1343 family)
MNGLELRRRAAGTPGHERNRWLRIRRAECSRQGAKLIKLFSPEHGIFGKQDTSNISAETDPTTSIHVTSLCGLP